MPPLAPISLILGGARSGKSRFAETLAETSGLEPVYLATGAAHDSEMATRIAAHRDRRGAEWRTLEEELELTRTLQDHAGRGRVILVDCLTMWTANLMGGGRNLDLEFRHLIEALPRLGGPVIFVSGEVGLGVAPDNAAARAFADHLGELNQKLAMAAAYVVLIAAGLPLVLKSPNQD